MLATSIDTRKSLRNYCVKKNANRYMYSLPTSVLNDLNIRTWKLNREVDQKRVRKICKSILATNRVIGVIYIAEVNTKLVCFDGNHRRLALEETNANTEDVFVLIMWNSTHEQVVEEFNSINLSVSVSSIHTSAILDNANKLAIRDYVKELVEKYPSMVSASTGCHRPKFNRDALEQNLHNIVTDFDTHSAADVIYVLRKLNKAYSNGDIRLHNIKPEVSAKCKVTGLWLFCTSRTIDMAQFYRIQSIYFTAS